MKEKKIVLGKRYLFCILGILLCIGAYFLKIPHAETVGVVPVAGTEMYGCVEETIQLINEWRVGKGRDPLILDSGLTEIAMERAYELFVVDTHKRPNGTNFRVRLREHGLSSAVVDGEVVAVSRIETSNIAKQGVDIFANSSAHAGIICATDFKYIGIGIAKMDNEGYSWCYILTNAPITGRAPDITSNQKVVKNIEVDNEHNELVVYYTKSLTYGDSGTFKVKLGGNIIDQRANVPIECVTLSSSNPNAVKVNLSTGDYNVIGTGDVVITAALPNGIKGTYSCSISPLDVRRLDIQIDGKATKDSMGYPVSASNFIYTYKGNDIKPIITASVRSSNITLTEGVDYTISYSTTTNTGTSRILAKATLTGKGKITGTYNISYYIDPDPSATIPQVQSVNISFSGGQQDSYVSGSSVYPVLSASASPSNAKVTGFKWTSSMPGVDLVTADNGKTCSVKVNSSFSGPVTITATSLDNTSVSSSVRISFTAPSTDIPTDPTTPTNPVVPSKVKVTSISLSADSRIEAGATTRAYATVYPSNASKKSVKWSSSNTSVATVDSNGYVKGINPGKATITATAADGSGVKGSKTVEVYVNLDTPSVSASNAGSGIVVKWSTSPSAEGYYIYRRSGKGKFQKIATVKGNSGTYTDKKAKNGTLYYYTVRSFRGSATSSYNKTGKPAYRLTNIKLSSISNKKGKKMYVKWGRNTKATGYQIQYSTSKSFYGAKTKTVKGGRKSSYTLSGLAKGKTYYVRIRAYYSKGGVKSYTSWSSTKYVKIKK